MLCPWPPAVTDLSAWPDLTIYAATVYLEAEGEPDEGKLAVAWTVRNRADQKRLSVRAICLAPMQYSCWNADYVKQRAARLTAPDDARWEACWRAAVGAYWRLIPDPTSGARHFLNVQMTRSMRGGTLPSWYDETKITLRVGKHTFLAGVA